HGAPGAERGLAAVDEPLVVGGVALGHARDDLAGGGIEALEHGAAGPLAHLDAVGHAAVRLADAEVLQELVSHVSLLTAEVWRDAGALPSILAPARGHTLPPCGHPRS